MVEKTKKATFEEALNIRLTGEALTDALNFAAFMRANKFTFKGKGKGGTWDINCKHWRLYLKTKCYATIFIEKNNAITIIIDFDESFIVEEDGLKNELLGMVTNCPQSVCKEPYCNNSRADWVLFGKTHTLVCHCPIQVLAPTAKQLGAIQQLMLMYKNK